MHHIPCDAFKEATLLSLTERRVTKGWSTGSIWALMHLYLDRPQNYIQIRISNPHLDTGDSVFEKTSFYQNILKNILGFKFQYNFDFLLITLTFFRVTFILEIFLQSTHNSDSRQTKLKERKVCIGRTHQLTKTESHWTLYNVFYIPNPNEEGRREKPQMPHVCLLVHQCW